MGPRVIMIRARAAPAEWNPYARLMIRRTRLLSPSCRPFDLTVNCTPLR